MSKYHDDNTFASDPGGVTLDVKKLEYFKLQLSFLRKILSYLKYPDELLDEHLDSGDSRAAVVIKTEPSLIVSAYTDELDCVVLLKFPNTFVEKYNLKVGMKLLTVNTYFYGSEPESDLYFGENNCHRYSNFYPLIADFLSSDLGKVQNRINSISDKEWEKAKLEGEKRMKKGVIPRNGSPYFSDKPIG